MGLGDGELAWPVSAPGSSLSIRGGKKKKKGKNKRDGKRRGKKYLECKNLSALNLLWELSYVWSAVDGTVTRAHVTVDITDIQLC